MLERSQVFRDLVRDLGSPLGGRTDEDQALALLLPEVRPLMRSYYAGRGGALDELVDLPSVRALDHWLSTEIARWSAEWSGLDPTRGGEATSTRAAVDDLLSMIAARPLPDEIARLVSRCVPLGGSRRNGSMDFDYRTLVEAYFSRAEYASAADELQQYHRKKVDLLEQELAFSLTTPELTRHQAARMERGPNGESPEFVAMGLRWVAQLCIEKHSAVSSPFPVRIEGLPTRAEAEIEARHSETIENAMVKLREAHRALLEDLVVLLDPGIVRRRVSSDRLYELGLPATPPDPIDFI